MDEINPLEEELVGKYGFIQDPTRSYNDGNQYHIGTSNSKRYFKKRKLSLFPSQLRFLFARQSEVLFSGGYGGGKTCALCLKAAIEGCKPGNIVMLCRKNFSDLEATTLRTLIEGDGKSQPVLPYGCYRYSKVEKRIDIDGGGTIYLVGFDDPMKLGSYNAGCVCVDEAWQIEEKEYMALGKRLRNDIGCRQIMLVTNPATYGHFLYKKFYSERGNNKNILAIEGCSEENVHLAKDYLENHLKAQCTTQQDYDKILMGRWVAQGKMVYPQWSNREFVVHREVINYPYYYVCVDYGYTNKMAMLLCGATDDNDIHIIDEFYMSHALHGDVFSKLDEWMGYVPTIIVDPSAALFIAELEARGADAIKAENAVDIGIGRVRNLLANKKITAEPKCKNFFDEINGYTFEDNGKPVKENDHLCFVAGTKILTKVGYKPIEDISKKDSVYDGTMYNRVTESIGTGNRLVSLYKINDKSLICTDDHPIFVNDIKIGIGELCKLYNEGPKRELLKKLNLKEGHTGDISITSIINTLPQAGGKTIRDTYIETYGLNIMEQYLQATRSTTKISTIQIILLKILKLLMKENICRFIPNAFIKIILGSLQNLLTLTKTSVENGMDQKTGESGIVSIVKSNGKICKKSRLNVHSAEENLKLNRISHQEKGISFASLTVKQNLENFLVSIILNLHAKYVEKNLLKINISPEKDATPVITSENIISLSSVKLTELPVYNLSVKNSHRYFANNILVSNCDALRYLANYLHSPTMNVRAPKVYSFEDWTHKEKTRLIKEGDYEELARFKRETSGDMVWFNPLEQEMQYE